MPWDVQMPWDVLDLRPLVQWLLRVTITSERVFYSLHCTLGCWKMSRYPPPWSYSQILGIWELVHIYNFLQCPTIMWPQFAMILCWFPAKNVHSGELVHNYDHVVCLTTAVIKSCPCHGSASAFNHHDLWPKFWFQLSQIKNYLYYYSYCSSDCLIFS